MSMDQSMMKEIADLKQEVHTLKIKIAEIKEKLNTVIEYVTLSSKRN